MAGEQGNALTTADADGRGIKKTGQMWANDGLSVGFDESKW